MIQSQHERALMAQNPTTLSLSLNGLVSQYRSLVEFLETFIRPRHPPRVLINGSSLNCALYYMPASTIQIETQECK